jgi:predicted transcriptional regulator
VKTFTFRYEPIPWKEASRAMHRVAKTGVSDIRANEMACDSLESMLKIMSKTRFELFAAIVEHRPGSLLELAKKTDKDQAQVLRDARTLEALGLIELVQSSDGGRQKLRPKALYDKIVFEFEPAKASKAG